MMSAYQTAVLLQYNNNDTLSPDELATTTNIGKDLFTQVLQPLVVKSRILINDETDQYDLNPCAPAS
jgi:cullin 1